MGKRTHRRKRPRSGPGPGHNKTKRRRRHVGGGGNKGPSVPVPVPKRACHPQVLVHGTTATEDTCLTNNLLQQLIDIHNKLYPSSKINSQLPAPKVLRILREKSSECQQSTHTDKCLLKKSGLEHHAEEVFATEHDWKKTREWLSNTNIKAVMDMYSKTYPEFHFFGPVPIDFNDAAVCPISGDNLCHFDLAKERKAGKTKFGFIFNLDFDKGPGTHWVSMFYDSSPKHPENALLYFFDSAGKNNTDNPAERNTPKDRFVRIRELADNIIRQAPKPKPVLMFNEKRHQSGNTECGVYSLFFVITMLTRKLDMSDELSNAELLDLFNGTHRIIPDSYIEQYRKVFFTEPDKHVLNKKAAA